MLGPPLESLALGECEFDIVVFGATGNAGKAISRHLAIHAPPALSWAVGGRDARALSALANSLREERALAAPEARRCAISAVIAACDDPDSLVRMATRTRLVLSAVGPYTTLGKPVVKACLAGGAHYADITGELGYAAQIRETYGEEARQKRLAFSSFCGYDCVPVEISVMLAREALASALAKASEIEGDKEGDKEGKAEKEEDKEGHDWTVHTSPP